MALLAVMGIILALLPLAAAVTIETRLDLLMQRNARSNAEAFYAAEAGLSHARAELRPSASLAGLLHGPDRTPGTADDGVFPFELAMPSDFTLTSSGYDVFAYAGPGGTVRLRSRGRGHNDALSEVEALLATNPAPFTPGALYVEASNADIDLGTRGYRVSGVAAHGGAGDVIAGIAISSSNAAEALHSSIAPVDAIVGTGPPPSIVATSPLDIDSYADALEQRPDGVLVSASEGGPLTLGTPASPQLTLISGAWTTTELVDGFGILLVRGDLEIRHHFEYRGLVIVDGNVELASSGDLQIEGALWSLNGLTSRLRLTGTGSLRYGPQVLATVDAAIPNALLHVPIIVAWREVS